MENKKWNVAGDWEGALRRHTHALLMGADNGSQHSVAASDA